MALSSRLRTVAHLALVARCKPVTKCQRAPCHGRVLSYVSGSDELSQSILVDVLFARGKLAILQLEAWAKETGLSATAVGDPGDLAAVAWTNFRPGKNRASPRKAKVGLLGRL